MVPQAFRRIYLTIAPVGPGTIRMKLSLLPPADASMPAVLMSKGALPEGWPLEIDVVSAGGTAIADAVAAYLAAHPPAAGQNATDAQVAAAVAAYMAAHPVTSAIGTVTVAQTATIAIAAGIRTVQLTLPGAAKGDRLIGVPLPTAALPNGMPAGYSIENVVASAANTVQVTLTAPLLAIGASYSISLAIARLN